MKHFPGHGKRHSSFHSMQRVRCGLTCIHDKMQRTGAETTITRHCHEIKPDAPRFRHRPPTVPTVPAHPWNCLLQASVSHPGGIKKYHSNTKTIPDRIMKPKIFRVNWFLSRVDDVIPHVPMLSAQRPRGRVRHGYGKPSEGNDLRNT